MKELATLKDRWVNFKLGDVYVPCPEEVLRELHANDILRGRVVDLSDGGLQANAYAVVQVEGLTNVLVVPAERILVCVDDAAT